MFCYSPDRLPRISEHWNLNWKNKHLFDELLVLGL
jgi:hypothetical protein